MRYRLATTLLVGTLLVSACATSRPARSGADGRVRVVAAENFWGSVVAQLAGDHAVVTSIISNPATDPHDYEATAQDARDIASADYVIVNGIGYDSWARKLLDADPASGRTVLDVGKLVGVEVGGNPHQWYSPAAVERFVARVVADLSQIDHADAGYFAGRGANYEKHRLAEYHGLIREIRQAYAGTPVGGSESIVAPLVSALGLAMETPESFLDAVAEGNEPTAHDTALVEQQIAQKSIKVFVFNRQNATPDVERLVDAARARGIPVTSVTETMVPRGVTFQDWQSRALRDLRDALAEATTS
jgi:zinc/manganese transport system substrate-binding protein